MTKIHYCSGPLPSEADLTTAIKDYQGSHSGGLLSIVIADNGDYFVYGSPNGRSHLAVRHQVIRLHERQKYPDAEQCFVFGRCRKAKCRCRGKFYGNESARFSLSPGWCNLDEKVFPEEDFDGLLAWVFGERRAYKRLANFWASR